ncbi:nitrite reductase [Alkalibacillus haloalkaliphilus]|uniref:nitrite reductase n=1 Tax=Alkalibacillus haloalkaliphilus TaxID=94136 RepID=UPI002936B010|nr:nitrite reductase [Alkalibacillus haloalkaliphilus]MDV2582966.1 nitrite reductase [Alkalibacillus haloalkaliphilus]
MSERYIPLAINGGISHGSWLKPNQLLALGEYLEEDQEIELTTLQQLIVKVPESQLEDAKKKFDEVGLKYYKVGNFVKSLRTCNFCKGEEEEGMPVAKGLNERIAGQEVPFTLRPAYTGCPVGCGEPLINDIGVMKKKDRYQLYIGGQAKGYNAKVGQLFAEDLTPDELYELVDKVLELYRQHGRKREKFPKFISRYGFENIREEVIV